MFASVPLRRLAAWAALGLAATAPAACSKPDASTHPIRTVADFDGNPCALMTEDELRNALRPPYEALIGVEPVVVSDPFEASTSDNHACVYAFKPGSGSMLPKITELKVTLGRPRNGSQPYAICVAGAGNKAPGYRIEKVGDQACLDPASNLWMKIAENYYQVVLTPQPGFTDPVEANLALSPMILAVARAASQRLPRT
jgi:hypothetical protein